MYKARFLEGVSDEVIDGFIGNALQSALNDSLSGNTAGLAAANQQVEQLRDVKRIPWQYRRGEIGMAEVHRRLIYNAVYDEIHMNAFNFVQATFDNLFFRFPTGSEFNVAYGMVSAGTPGVLFGQGGQNKGEYVTIVTSNTEFLEGMVRWCHQTLLGRLPSTQEVFTAMAQLQITGDLQAVQRRILVSDEYAGFGP
jgi:hypothetical protein